MYFYLSESKVLQYLGMYKVTAHLSHDQSNSNYVTY